MNKEERIRQVIADNLVIKATSPWDGEARFDRYSVIIHKYDNEDLAFIETNDPRITNAAERILQLIDTDDWCRLIDYYRSVKPYTQPDGERKPIARGGRKENK